MRVETDLVIAVLIIPFPLLWKLRLTGKQKILLAAIFLLPSLPIAFAILKLIWVNPKSEAVDMIKFHLYYMLENSAGMSSVARFVPI